MSRSWLLILLCTVLLSGCAYTPPDLLSLRLENLEKDRAFLFGRREAPQKPLTLEDVIVLALTRNVEFLVREQEYRIQRELATGEQLRMLPSLTANVEVAHRNEESSTVSKFKNLHLLMIL